MVKAGGLKNVYIIEFNSELAVYLAGFIERETTMQYNNHLRSMISASVSITFFQTCSTMI